MLKHLTFVSVDLIWNKMTWFVLFKSTDKWVIVKWCSMTGTYAFHTVTWGFMSLNLKINKTLEETKECQTNVRLSTLASDFWCRSITLGCLLNILVWALYLVQSFFSHHQCLWLPHCTQYNGSCLRWRGEHQNKVNDKSLLLIHQHQYPKLV